jgi:RNA polymerase sigma-70 factor (ECF subfamily)
LGSKRSLLRRVRALEEEAIGTVFDMYYPSIYRYVYHHVHHRPTAEDLAGEVFTRMLEQLVDGGGPDRNLKAWLYRVAYNLLVDNSRRQVHRDHEPLAEQVLSLERDVDEQVHQNLLQEQAQAALDTLTPKQRTVIVLNFLEGWSNSEVARVMQTSVGAVKALQHRGLASMRRYMLSSGAKREGAG